MFNIHAVLRPLLAAGLGAAFACGSALAATPFDEPKAVEESTVVFVCNYGSVKSLMAAARFNELAKERGLPIRAVSRAATEKTVHSKVPDAIQKHMANDGVDVANYKPKALTRDEASKAMHVVHITLEDLTKDVGVPSASHRTVERWEGLASGVKDYNKAKAALRPRVDALFEAYAKKHAGGSVATR